MISERSFVYREMELGTALIARVDPCAGGLTGQCAQAVEQMWGGAAHGRGVETQEIDQLRQRWRESEMRDQRPVRLVCGDVLRRSGFADDLDRQASGVDLSCQVAAFGAAGQGLWQIAVGAGQLDSERAGA